MLRLFTERSSASLRLVIVCVVCCVAGCASTHPGTERPAADADQAVARVRAILPTGWIILRIERETYPFYRARGKGVAVYLAPPKPNQRKSEYEGAVFIMPSTYRDLGGD